MQGYDVLMILVLAGATLFGFWKGVAWQIASIASLIVSYFVSLSFAGALAPLFGAAAPFNKFVAMFVVYIVSSLAIWMVFRVVSDFIDRVKLKEFDRQIGALFGLAKGVLLCVAITLFAVCLLPDAKKETILTSRSGYYIGQLLDDAHAVMPAEVHDVVHPYLHKAQEKLNPGSSFHHAGNHTAEEHRRWLDLGLGGEVEGDEHDHGGGLIPARIPGFGEEPTEPNPWGSGNDLLPRAVEDAAGELWNQWKSGWEREE